MQGAVWLCTDLIQRSGHSRDIIQQVDEHQHPCGHLKAEDEDSEEEVAQDEQAGGNAVDDVSLETAKDLVAVLDCGDDGADTLLQHPCINYIRGQGLCQNGGGVGVSKDGEIL